MTDAPSTSTLQAGRYTLRGVLGAGSQAETWDALDAHSGRAVAIKRFQVRGAKSWKDVELAEREARVLATLRHPNLPVYLDHFEEDGVLYLVMEKIEGESLASVRRRRATLSSQEIARFLEDADGVLRYLQSRVPPLIHRDIKPGNVIRRTDGSFAFVDFGSVRDQLKPEGGSTVVGTFGYMAPEQFQGRALPGSDVYAVGATALSLVTGREPEECPHRGLAIDVAAALGRGAEPWLVRALSAMLEPDPDRRPTAIPGLGSRSRPPPSGETLDYRQIRERGREERRRIRDDGRRLREELKAQVEHEAGHARRAARTQRRAVRARHWAKSGRGRALPLLMTLIAIALSLARVATWAIFSVLLPTVLLALSPFLGRGLRRAAWRSRELAHEAERGLKFATASLHQSYDGDRSAEDASDATEEAEREPRQGSARPVQPARVQPGRVRVDPGSTATGGDVDEFEPGSRRERR